MNRGDLTRAVKAQARALGFDKVAIAEAAPLERDRAALAAWLTGNRHATMAWMAREPQKRSDPEAMMPGCKSVVALAVNYGPGELPPTGRGSGTRRPLRAGARLPQNHGPEAQGPGGVAGGDDRPGLAHVRGHGTGSRACVGRARGPRMDREERESADARSRLVDPPGRDPDRSLARRRRRPSRRFLRDVHGLPRRLPDEGDRRARCRRFERVHLVLDDRAPRRDPGGEAGRGSATGSSAATSVRTSVPGTSRSRSRRRTTRSGAGTISTASIPRRFWGSTSRRFALATRERRSCGRGGTGCGAMRASCSGIAETPRRSRRSALRPATPTRWWPSTRAGRSRESRAGRGRFTSIVSLRETRWRSSRTTSARRTGRSAGLMVRYGLSNAEKTAFTKNVSETGLFLQTNQVFKPGRTIQVQIQFPRTTSACGRAWYGRRPFPPGWPTCSNAGWGSASSTPPRTGSASSTSGRKSPESFKSDGRTTICCGTSLSYPSILCKSS